MVELIICGNVASKRFKMSVIKSILSSAISERCFDRDFNELQSGFIHVLQVCEMEIGSCVENSLMTLIKYYNDVEFWVYQGVLDTAVMFQHVCQCGGKSFASAEEVSLSLAPS